ncbi:MAG: peroxiredoxin [Abitibacteriaceae bacterium]|nr:peroxiredoxin [Abditibacteriaceae bacterium]
MPNSKATQPSTLVPQVGQPLPDFSLPMAMPNANGDISESTLTTQSARGQSLVLFFYPKDATSGCTIEVCGFRDLYPEFQKENVQVVGVSRDNIRSHIRFIQNQNLPYPLAADLGGELIKSWGLLVNKTMYGKPVTGVLRTTLLIDREGIVRHIFEKVTPLGHAQQVLDAVRAGFE